MLHRHGVTGKGRCGGSADAGPAAGSVDAVEDLAVRTGVGVLEPDDRLILQPHAQHPAEASFDDEDGVAAAGARGAADALDGGHCITLSLAAVVHEGRAFGYAQDMSEFHRGDAVTWSSHGNTVHGKVLRKITDDTEAGGRTVRASNDEPQYEVESDNGGTAVHKPDALSKA